MQDNTIVRVFLEAEGEERYTSMQAGEGTTSEEVSKYAVQKLVGNSADIKDFALFLRVKTSDGKEKDRRLAGFELPAAILRAANGNFDLKFFIQVIGKAEIQVQREESQGGSTLILKEGPLKLRGKRRFKDRYFLLTRSHLLYAHSQKTMTSLSASIHLADIVVSPVNENTFGKFSFELITHMKIFILKAESAEEKGKWMRAIQSQVEALESGKALRAINAQLRACELSRSDRDISLISACCSFSSLLSQSESRDLFYTFLSPTKRETLRLLAAYRDMCGKDAGKAVGLAQTIVTEMLKARKRGEMVAGEDVIAEKLRRFFGLYDLLPTIPDSEAIAMESLFADVEMDIMREVREVDYPRIVETVEFRNAVLKLPARRLLAPWGARIARETSSSHRKSRSFFLPSS